MLLVRPNELLPIWRHIDDPYDNNTYYVRAVIKNAVTLATLDTVTLTDNADHSFSSNWRTPADAVGLGLYIVITTTIYTDSGYTTKSEMYKEEAITYKIEINKAHFGGGGGGGDVSYKKIREIVQEEIKSLPTPEVNIPQTDLAPLVSGLQDVVSVVRAIKIPEPEKLDLSAVLEASRTILGAIKALKFPETDLSPVMQALEREPEEVRAAKDMKKEISDIFKKITTYLSDDMTAIRDGQESLSKKFDEVQIAVIQKKE